MTPLTAEQYSELVVALEAMRGGCSLNKQWVMRYCTDWCYIYLTQWFHRIGPLPDDPDALRYACAHMVAELCEERTTCAR